MCLRCFTATQKKRRPGSDEGTYEEFLPHTARKLLQGTEHDPSHGYRVCDSLWFPVFPSHKEEEEGEGEATTTTASTFGKWAVEWTCEEDLRLLDGIERFGLGNWGDVSEHVNGGGIGGQGLAALAAPVAADGVKAKDGDATNSVKKEGGDAATTTTLISPTASSGANKNKIPRKTPKKCMERYLDDFLGVVEGLTVPSMTFKPSSDDNNNSKAPATVFNGRSYNAVPTTSSPSLLNSLPPSSDLCRTFPPAGSRIPRENLFKLQTAAQRSLDKAIRSVPSSDHAKQLANVQEIHADPRFKDLDIWPVTKVEIMNMKGGSTSGYMPRRGDFDVEWDDLAEETIADMEFGSETEGEASQETEQEREVKVRRPNERGRSNTRRGNH